MAHSTETRYEHQRLAAIRSAAAVFAEKGYHGASTADIAAHLGMKQGSLYYYFKSKEEALCEVCLLGIRDYVKRMSVIADSDQPFAAKVLATVSSHLMSYREKNEALKVYNDERLYLPEGKRKKLKTLGSRYRQQLETIFEDARSAGIIRATVNCHFAAQSVIGLCNSWGHLIVRDPELDVFILAQQCTDLIMQGVTAEQKD